METFPAYFSLTDKRVVIAGDGDPAEAKARLFEGSPARLVRLTGAEALDPAAYAGASLIFIASHDPAFCEAAAAAARRAGAPINVADQPDLSDFHTPAIIDRGQVVAAIGTAGASPLLASLLRTELEMRIPESAGAVAALLGEERAAVRDAFPDLGDRRAFLRRALTGPTANAAARGDVPRARTLLAEALAQARTSGGHGAGRVSFLEVGATPDLISLRAARVLAEADVVVAAKAAAGLLASHGRRDAERIAPAEATVDALAALARRGRLVAVVGGAIGEGGGRAGAEAGLAEALGRLGVAVEALGAASAS